MASPEE